MSSPTGVWSYDAASFQNMKILPLFFGNHTKKIVIFGVVLPERR
jgi:hypothetical protein